MIQSEKGFTLLETLVVAVVSAIVALGAGMALTQIILRAPQNTDQETVTRQAQSAAFWINNDVIMSRSVDVGDDPDTGETEFIVVHWRDWQTAETHSIYYIWLDSAESLKKLKRNDITFDIDEEIININSTLVADNVYSANLTTGNPNIFTIETRSGKKSITREYEIRSRS